MEDFSEPNESARAQGPSPELFVGAASGPAFEYNFPISNAAASLPELNISGGTIQVGAGAPLEAPTGLANGTGARDQVPLSNLARGEVIPTGRSEHVIPSGGSVRLEPPTGHLNNFGASGNAPLGNLERGDVVPGGSARTDLPNHLYPGTHVASGGDNSFGARPVNEHRDVITYNNPVERNIQTASLVGPRETVAPTETLPFLQLANKTFEPVLPKSEVFPAKIISDNGVHSVLPVKPEISNVENTLARLDIERKATIHPASHAVIADPEIDNRQLLVLRQNDAPEPLSRRMSAFLDHATSFFTSSETLARLQARVQEGIRRNMDLAAGIIPLSTILNSRHPIPAAFNLGFRGPELAAQAQLLADFRPATISKVINAIKFSLGEAPRLTLNPGLQGDLALTQGLKMGDFLTARGILSPNFHSSKFAGLRADASAQTFTIRGDLGKALSINLTGSGLTGSIDTRTGKRIRKTRKPGEAWTPKDDDDEFIHDKGDSTCTGKSHYISGLELGLIVALAGIAKYDGRDKTKQKELTSSEIENAHLKLDPSELSELICRSIDSKRVERRLPSYNWNNQWKSPGKIEVQNVLKKLKEKRKDLKDQDFRKLESSTNAEELFNRLSKIVSKDQNRLEAKRLLSKFGGTSLEEKLKTQPSTPYTATQNNSNYRPLWLVTKRDSLTVLAEQIYQNPDVGWLIADMNVNRIKETWMNGKRIIELQSRQQIELPIQEDIDLFLAGKAREAVGENLITIVVENQLDKELINKQLQALQIKRKAVGST